MYEVNYSGEEVKFECLKDAIDFQDALDVGSDLWERGAELKLLRSRIEMGWGVFEVEDYM